MAILVAVLGVFAWQQGDGGDGDGPLNAIAAAAGKTQEEPGGRAAMKAVVSAPARSEPLTMTGQMVFSTETGRTEALLTVPGEGSEEPVEMRMIGDGTMLYMRSDALGSLPDGKEWMGIDLALGEDLGTVPTDVDAKGELELLEEAAGEVRKVGKEDVRGVATTRYRGTIAVSEQVERLLEEGAEDLASFIEEKGSPLRIEAWIDGDGLMRRMRIVTSQPEEDGEGMATTDVRTDFIDFGPAPKIELPDSDEVFDATSLVAEELGVSGD